MYGIASIVSGVGIVVYVCSTVRIHENSYI